MAKNRVVVHLYDLLVNQVLADSPVEVVIVDENTDEGHKVSVWQAKVDVGRAGVDRFLAEARRRDLEGGEED